jgi:heme-degrading monooxygenase HmoA
MFARIHTLHATPAQQDEGLEIVRDVFLPWARDSEGFRGLMRLTDPEHAKVLVITLWETEEALKRSAGAAERIGADVAAASGATRTAMESYEVSLIEVDSA